MANWIKDICRSILKEEIDGYLGRINDDENRIHEMEKNANSQAEEISRLKLLIDNQGTDSIKPTGTISYNEIMVLLKKYCSEVHLSDLSYSTCPVEKAKEYSVSTKIFIKKWIAEQHDCDEFSFSLMGYWNLDLYQYPFGIAWSDSHAFNIFIDDKKEVYVVEPQTNKFTPIKDMLKNKTYYPFRFIII